ncbi:hypothetical protein A3B32_02200 [Candidatus Uhrbacteria bacterium RIFCSPLOWO2_01_FULL_53_9]|uniref:ABC transporter substrate-binding protein n=3 Tax=Candidatus Uhriibacteriota TaxID=1752732 RepID=A0A1F7UXV8_9BACT|nr:MAG: hypothetical protein A3C17_04020 [Candidatus Uhrbacteria bacterium RIFCSPHIGHO2_02_FULL_53_13]OGL83120.1 MAG: hypothetical protein A3B32_02200 [Candidatus Uhrbacteria bacterium RIFCSPLOWO2_01_FULL_53_9]OGL89564.1 MAG: hypothetical protein A3I45_04785 [Candidatus Uhrbacteria bacterium RIFCSPLOWO2_02_FULL_53_10]
MVHKHIPVLIALLLVLVVLPGLGCRGGTKEAKEALQPVTLDMWGVFDNPDAFRETINGYRAAHPNVRINYRKLRYDEYQDELLRAFAEDRGPDVFAVHNTWMKGYLPLIEPMPETVKIAYKEVRGTVKKEEVVVVRTEPTMSLRDLSDDYVQVVSEDVVYQAKDGDVTRNRIHGLSLSVDTLALFYNKDILDAAGIPEPPKTWDEFQEQVIKLTRYDAKGNVAQSGAGIGTGANVDRAVDIVSLLMMQNETQMTNSAGRATFAQRAQGSRAFPAIDAVRFYTDFANPTKESYTWGAGFPSSFDAFASGQTAFFFGYSYHIPLLSARAQKINYDIAPVPQLGSSRVDYANYWIHTVSKKSKSPDWAWDFVLYAADKEQVMSYLNAAQKPTALRALILEQLDDAQLGVFADQVLTAQDWYNGSNAIAAENAIVQMIDAVVEGDVLIEEALPIAEQQVNQTL